MQNFKFVKIYKTGYISNDTFNLEKYLDQLNILSYNNK